MNRIDSHSQRPVGWNRMPKPFIRQLVRAGAVLVLALLTALAISGRPAMAAVQYPLLGEITAGGALEGKFYEDKSIAIDNVSKSVLVPAVGEMSGDAMYHTDMFGFSGAFQGTFGATGGAIAANDSSGYIYQLGLHNEEYVWDSSIYVYSPAGEYISQFKPSSCDVHPPIYKCFEPLSIAIDQATGNVYVYERNAEVIDVFSPGGEYLSQIASAGGQSLGRRVGGMAVDGVTGNLLVADESEDGHSVVYIFNAATGAYSTSWNGSNTPQGLFYGELGVGTNGVTGDIYVSSEPAASKAVIDQFSSAGDYKGQIRGTPSGPLSSVHAIAVDQTSGDVYAATAVEQAFVVDVFAANGVGVPHVALGAPSVQSTSATLRGFVNPEETGEAVCEFEYGTSMVYGRSSSCGGPVPNGSSSVEVEAHLSGLQPDTTYYYRLDGKSVVNGYTNTGEGSEDLGELHTRGPGIREESVSNVAATSATFEATINPNKAATTYYFQYGTNTEYGEDVPAPPGEAIGLGAADVEGSRLYVRELSPSTVYHYRVVAVSESKPGEFETLYGADHTFTTQAAGGSFSLADGRQWELVSPPDKLGALIEVSEDTRNFTQASANGDAIAYQATSPTERELQGFAVAETVFSTRGGQNWSSQDISAPNIRATRASSGVGHEFEIFSEDLSLAAIQPQTRLFTPFSPEASETTPYLRTDYAAGDVEDGCSSSCYQPLVTGKEGFANVPPGTVFGGESNGVCEVSTTLTCGPLFQGASPDLNHVVLSSSAQLTKTPAPAGGQGLYEWSDGSLRLLDVLPAGEEGPAVLAGSGNHSGVNGAVSRDGERVILEGGATGGSGLYLRDAYTGETVRLDVPQGGSGPSGHVSYMDANSDASRIFFLDSGRLTPGSSPSGGDLYEYDLNAPTGSTLSDLTVDTNAGQPAGVMAVIGASQDGSYVYFVAGGALTPDATPHDCRGSGQSGGCNLYVRHEGVTRLVAALSSEDLYDWEKESFGLHVRARISPNGRWLAFMSAAELTGYDSHDVASGKSDQEVYLYDATSGGLVCGSCNPTEARPVGAFRVGTGPKQIAASVPPWVGSPDPGVYGGSYVAHQPRYLSNSGRLFFDSTDALVAQDVDGVEDVYEYEPAGVGSCSSSSATFVAHLDGCVNLVSAGSSPAASTFMDASESGGDVFFLTQSRLATQDYDTVADVYDAHECTGAAPCLPVTTQPPACTSESSCRAAPALQPSLYGAPASATFSGAGNLVPATPGVSQPKAVKRTPKCKKGLVRNSKGRCVKQRRSKRAKRAGHEWRAGK